MTRKRFISALMVTAFIAAILMGSHLLLNLSVACGLFMLVRNSWLKFIGFEQPLLNAYDVTSLSNLEQDIMSLQLRIKNFINPEFDGFVYIEGWIYANGSYYPTSNNSCFDC